MQRERIIVLGGGIGALAAVWGITSTPGWEQRYEITVYQLGWRLGGKGASGRNAKLNQRIEEHGLHIWGGFYENAFRLMRQCYAELDRPAGAPLARWDEAFRPRRDIQMQEQVGGVWKTWPVHFADQDGTPGDGVDVPTPLALIRQAVTLQLAVLRNAGLAPEQLGNLPAILRSVRRVLALFGVEGARGVLGNSVLLGLLGRARAILAARRDAWLNGDDAARRLFYLIDLTLAIVRGAVGDGVLIHGFDAIDDYDLTDWLRRWGASDDALGSVTVRAFYDYVFGYVSGDSAAPRLAAGTALVGVLRLMFCYRGSFFYEMQGGMGDVVFTPLYEVLRRRGVRFAFFHRVEALQPDAAGRRVDAVTFTQQVRLNAGDDAEYAPLVDVDGLPCWPSEPDWSQIEGGDALAAAGVDLERPVSDWPGVGQRTLRYGVDFDKVVLGVSVGEHPRICAELMAVDARYRRMVLGLKTVRTQSVQLWFQADPRAAAAPDPAVISTGYAKPFDTWADMSFLLPIEHWGAPFASRGTPCSIGSMRSRAPAKTPSCCSTRRCFAVVAR